jgi:colanic acid biosynthesis glycosyl transferase WcaI
VARLCGARAWLHVQDYEVDAAFELGLLRGRLLKRMVGAAERWLMRRFDRVSTISSRMLDLARRKGVDEDSLVLFPNWIDLGATRAMDGTRPGRVTDSLLDYRSLLNIPQDALVAMYAGNLGGKQGLSTLADVARILRRHPDIYFVFCGEGPQREDLQRRCGTLQHVRFLPLQPADRIGELLASADVHLLPQRAGAADLVMPSKLTGMLASGRPVICGAAPGTELAAVVAGCGIVVPPENARAMARALLNLGHQREQRLALGLAAWRYAQANLDKDTVLTRFEQHLSSACAPRAPLADTP